VCLLCIRSTLTFLLLLCCYVYRPIYNLSLISKIIERIVKSRLTLHISTNNLNAHKSAYYTLLKQLRYTFTITQLMPLVPRRSHVSAFLTSLQLSTPSITAF